MTYKKRLAPLVVIALGLSSCGSSAGGLSRSQLIAKADPICKRVNTKLHQFYAVQTLAELPGAAAEFSRSAMRLSSELASLQAPSSMTGDWKAITGSYRLLGHDIAEAGARIKTERLPKPDAALANTLFRVEHDRVEIASRNGFHDCAQY